MRAKRAAARRAGGLARAKPVVTPPDALALPLADAGDVASFLAKVANETRQGKLDPRTANSLGSVLNTLLRALDDGRTEELLRDAEKRLAAVEAELKALR
jgi:hypothetical protein